MELRTIYNTFNQADADLLCGRLQAAGFDSSMQGEFAGVTVGSFSSAGGIRILVPEDQADDARALIEAELKARNEPD